MKVVTKIPRKKELLWDRKQTAQNNLGWEYSTLSQYLEEVTAKA
ncbi:hypothetical protein [Photobacterium sp. BZF1]|nr:hypothetical protein [Photobacterium sp. BZF1]